MYKRSNYWKRLAKKWDYLAPPFRSHEQDVNFISEFITGETPTFRTKRIVILGVTPEFACMKIPDGSELIAVDSCPEMIEHVWPEMPHPNRKAIMANWLDLPFDNCSCDIILGDGVFGTMRYPVQSKEFLRSVKKVLHPDGLLVIRTFLQDEKNESPAEVIDAVYRGEIGSLNAFKFRLIRSIQPDIETGANYGKVWEVLVNQQLDFSDLAEETGWPLDGIETMKLYNGADFVVTYPTLSQLRGLLEEVDFNKVDCFSPDYELGEYCQTLVVTPSN